MHRSAQQEANPVSPLGRPVEGISMSAPPPARAVAARPMVDAAARAQADTDTDTDTDAGPQRLSPWFGLTGLLLLATLLAAVFVQARQYTLLNLTVQYQDDYLALSLQQVETEYLRLREQLRRDSNPADSTALQLRYDVFVSRVSLLGGDRTRRLLSNAGDSASTLGDLDGFIRQADLYLGAAPHAPFSPQAASTLLQALEALDTPIHQLMLDATHRVAAQVTERQAQVRNHNQIGLALTAFLVAMVLLFALIMLRQVRSLELRRHRLSRLADELRDARIEAESASDAKSEFLADMSHELRTPLHGLLGMLSLIKDAPRDPRAGDWLLTADESAQHLRRLLDDILDLSKLDAGSLALTPSAVSLVDLLREVRSLLQPSALAKGLTLQVDIDPALPPLALLDGTRVRQVLFNLVTNAIKYSEVGVVTLQCRQLAQDGHDKTPGAGGQAAGRNDRAPGAGGQAPGAAHRQAMVEFSVSDTGIGMDRETVSRLFRRHSRAEDVRAWRQSGTGLGLAISRNLARLMGGEILVRSTLEAGSVFSFHCPLHPVNEAPAPSLAAAPGPVEISEQPARPLQVLVAEDHPVNRLYLAALLARLGHQVKLVDNGLEAVRAMQPEPGTGPDVAAAASPVLASPFDLILMDVHMPVMDGVVASQAIRQLPGPAGQVCIVAITADVFDDTRARCMAAGVVEVVTKPLSLDALRALLVRRFGDAAGLPPSAVAPASEPVTNPAHSLLDRNTVHNVCGLMGSDKAPSLYGSFFTQADDAARRMRVAMRDADPEALRRSAHTVKGAALNLGLPALAAAAALLTNEAGTLAAAPLALAVQRFEELTQASRALCAGEGLLR